MLVVDFKVPKDADWDDTFQLVDAEGEPIDLTGAELELTVKLDDPPATGSQTVLTAATTNGKILVSDAAKGEFGLNVLVDEVATLPDGRHNHVLRIKRSGTTKRLWFGSVTVTEAFA